MYNIYLVSIIVAFALEIGLQKYEKDYLTRVGLRFSYPRVGARLLTCAWILVPIVPLAYLIYDLVLLLWDSEGRLEMKSARLLKD